MKIYAFAFFLLAAFPPKQVLAQAPTPTPLTTATSAVTNPVPKSFSEDILDWELGMAENSYSINANLRNKIQLLNIYEKVIGKRCMPELFNNLAFNPVSLNTECKQLVKKAFDLDAGNPVATCAQYGIDDIHCKTACERIIVRNFDPVSEQNTGEASLEEVINLKRDGEANSKEILRLANEINAIQHIAYQDRSRKVQIKLEVNMERYLALSCRGSKIDLRENETIETPTPTPTNTPASSYSEVNTAQLDASETISPYAEIARSIAQSDAKLAQDAVPASTRIFKIPYACSSAIRTVKDVDADFGRQECYAWGFYTRQCIEALRKAKSRPPLKAATIKAKPVATLKIIDSF